MQWQTNGAKINVKEVFIETFATYDDADTWLSKHIEEHKDHHILEASILFVRDGAWRAGIMFIDDVQGELDV